jgi:acetyl esterase/lipase
LLAAGLWATAYRIAERDGRQALRGLARIRRVADMAGAVPMRAETRACSMGEIPAEVVRAPNTDPSKAVLYLHGGGFVFGSPRSHRGIAARLSHDTGCAVWLPHYRLAPEHPFPAAFDDALAAYRWLITDGGVPSSAVVVAGDSAGGQLATALTAALSSAPLPTPAALVLFSPWLDLDGESLAQTRRSIRDPFFSVAYATACSKVYRADHDPADPRLNILTSDLLSFPPVLLQVGGTEILTDGAQRFATKLRDAGAPIDLQIWPGQVHVWHAFANLLPEGKQALREAARFINDQLTAEP